MTDPTKPKGPTPDQAATPVERGRADRAGTEAHSTPTVNVTTSVLWLLIFSVLSVDWLLPLRGLLSTALLVAASALFLPWSLLVVSSSKASARAPLAPDGDHKLRGLFLHLALIAMVLGLLVAKWLVLQAAGTDPAFAESSRSYSLGLLVLMTFGIVGRGLGAARFITIVAEHPARLMAISFGFTGILGTFLLSLPVSVNSMDRVSLVDNLFMAFSAVCVTGLAVVSIPETYSLFGQAVLLGLVQVGGLGIMVLSSAIALVVGQRMRVRSSAVLTEMVDGGSIASLRRTVLMICVYTLLIEGVGALLLLPQLEVYPEIRDRVGHPIAGAGSAEWAAVFHAVSAFCNAGFSNLHGGLMPFTGKPGILGVASVLIVLGGIGFPVLDELARAIVLRLRRRRLPLFSLSSRVALRVTGLLLLAMTFAYLVLEWRHSFNQLSYGERFLAALFQSASARTAGFNVVDVGAMLPATLLLTTAAMFIGASPSSTGGGIKTTTFAALFAGLRAELTGKAPRLLSREIPDTVIRKAIGVAFLSILIVFSAFFLMLLFESHPALDLMFEVVSAFSTTGLSTGITPRLTIPGKLVITALMFVGRIGPLTLALAVAIKAKPSTVALPQERLMIG